MNNNLINDIYYKDEYISLYLKEHEELFTFEYKEDKNIFINKTIKRPISSIGHINVNDCYYDLESAYGYGGYYTNNNDMNFLNRAMIEYEKRCNDENIIAEFIRFHPFNSFPIQNETFLDFNFYDRDVVIVPLEDNVLSSYTSKVRNVVKRSLEKVLIRQSTDIDSFIELYNKTMDKNEADSFYYFDKKMYERLLSLNNVNLYEVIFEDEVIAMGFFLFGSHIAHYHLSANSDISYKLNTNYALLHSLFEIANKNGQNYFLLGGGTSSNKDDNLLKFKQKFSKNTKPFYISGKVFNRKIYDNYNKLWTEQSNEDIRYFLKYRMEIK